MAKNLEFTGPALEEVTVALFTHWSFHYYTSDIIYTHFSSSIIDDPARRQCCVVPAGCAADKEPVPTVLWSGRHSSRDQPSRRDI